MQVADIQLSYLDLRAEKDWLAFSQLGRSFFQLLSHSYDDYYGESYHVTRLERDRPLIFLIKVDGELSGVSTIKQSGRRSAIAISPEFRRYGLATKLVRYSLEKAKQQYSVVSQENIATIGLLAKLGFVFITSEQDARRIAIEEQHLFSSFVVDRTKMTFARYSETRKINRKSLVMLAHGFF